MPSGGLGDRLVSGLASPDDWLVRGMQAVRRSTPEGAISAKVAVEVAQLARRVAAHQEAPQDIEWALVGSELVLLQARPITTLQEQLTEPVPVPVEVPPGYWEREAVRAPKPRSPMSISVAWGDSVNRAMRRVFSELGLLAETFEIRQIGGWEYSRLVPLGGKDGPAPPAFLMPLLIRVVPALRRRIADAVAAVRTDKPGRFIEQWYGEWRPDLIARIEQLRNIDLATLDDRALDADAGRAVELVRQGNDIHLLLHGALMPILAELAFTCQELLGWSDQEALELLGGLSTTSTQPAHRLAHLARLAADRPAVSSLLATIDRRTASRLADADPEFAQAFDDYQREFACRALNYEFAEPSLAETPELTLQLLADQVARKYDPDAEAAALAARRKAAKEEARAALAGRPSAERERFERALARAERAYPIREDNEFFTYSVPLALIRYRLLEIGRRLLQRVQLSRIDDIFFLNWEEARSALRTGEDRRALVTSRRGQRVFVEQHPGPRTYGTDRLQPGEVLVCPITSPVWSVLFPNVGALVTDTGGVLSHSAIIAREYQLPAVVAAGNATALLRDGQQVTVDGSTGQIDIQP